MEEHDYRYIAQVTVEAQTPLAVSSGKSDIVTDSPVCTDANGFPMIPGTSLTGVLRHQLAQCYGKDSSVEKEVFGFQHPHKVEESQGSRIIVSCAHILKDSSQVVESLLEEDTAQSSYLTRLQELPIREHCRIGHKGATDAQARGKFNEQVVPKGVRFKFEIELIAGEHEETLWNDLLSLLKHPAFRIGGGTRKGFGNLKIVELETKTFFLQEQLEEYLNKSASLNSPLDGAPIQLSSSAKGWKKYTVNLEPEDFWLFGSGFPDQEADMTPVYEMVVEGWENGSPHFTEKLLIPATSIKGAVSHRLAYHYNRLNKVFAENCNIEKHVGENNKAVKELFGCAKESRSKQGQIGKVILSDVFLANQNEIKILNHVAIDRFTGGASDSALFSEKVISQKTPILLEIWVKEAFADKKILPAFEATLDDICNGSLPLGGGVMRGHGVFKGNWETKEVG